MKRSSSAERILLLIFAPLCALLLINFLFYLFVVGYD